MNDVDLVVNVWERTYRRALKPGFFPDIEEQNQRALNKILLINNVADTDEVERLADNLIAKGEIQAYHLVAEHLPRALELTGLTLYDLGRIPHYSTPVLVAVTLPGNDWLLYWDAEIQLKTPNNWINPAIDLMKQDNRVLFSNPNWARYDLDKEILEVCNKFVLGYGFSDQCFLVRRSDLAKPIYNVWCPASLRYPLSCIAPVFEQRIDAFARLHMRLRATYIDAIYEHPDNEGESYPNLSLREKIQKRINQGVLLLFDHLPTINPRFKINPKLTKL